jgi:hypothetical protein
MDLTQYVGDENVAGLKQSMAGRMGFAAAQARQSPKTVAQTTKVTCFPFITTWRR